MKVRDWVCKDKPSSLVNIVQRLSKDIIAILTEPNLNSRFSQLGATAFAPSSVDFGRFVAAETDK